MTTDATDPIRLAGFWMVALDYVEALPPAGSDSWESWLADQGVPPNAWGDGATITDPGEVGPAITFLKVPELKSAKNRLHPDLQASSGRHLPAAARRQRIDEVVEVLTALGATTIEHHFHGDDFDHIVLSDPEGNEFCPVTIR